MPVLGLYYNVNPAGWVTCHWLHYLWPGCRTSALGGLTLRETPPPELPGEGWVRVRTLMAGICGSDTALTAQKQPGNSILQAFSSQPMALGHENLGIVEERGAAVDASWQGRRVCVEPSLNCFVRGIAPPCDRCAAGQFSVCENMGAAGEGAAGLPAGHSIGFNSRTGGGFCERFVAHASQLIAVPEEIPDELAVLTDPISCAMHAALRANLSEAKQVLVYGTGSLGLALVACLRAVGYEGRIDALGRRKQHETLARQFGADEFLRLPKDRAGRFAEVARRTGGRVHAVRFGNYMLTGGYDACFDCLGTAQSVTECLKWTRGRGQVLMVATSRGGRIDLTPLWFRELDFVGVSGRQIEQYAGLGAGGGPWHGHLAHVSQGRPAPAQKKEDHGRDARGTHGRDGHATLSRPSALAAPSDGRHTYEIVHEMMRAGTLDLRGLLTHTFRLSEYRQAFDAAMHKGRHEAVKVAFDFRQKA